MKIQLFSTFKASFFDCTKYLCDAEKQAYETGKLKEFRRATWNIDRCFPEGTIEKYSLPEKDVFCFTPNADINIKIQNNKSKTKELDSLIKLSDIIQKLS